MKEAFAEAPTRERSSYDVPPRNAVVAVAENRADHSSFVGSARKEGESPIASCTNEKAAESALASAVDAVATSTEAAELEVDVGKPLTLRVDEKIEPDPQSGSQGVATTLEHRSDERLKAREGEEEIEEREEDDAEEEEEDEEEEEKEDEEAMEEREGGGVDNLRRLSTILRDEDEPEYRAGESILSFFFLSLFLSLSFFPFFFFSFFLSFSPSLFLSFCHLFSFFKMRLLFSKRDRVPPSVRLSVRSVLFPDDENRGF